MRAHAALLTLAVLCLSGTAAAREVKVIVDNLKAHQTIEGFGATTLNLVDGGTDLIGAMRPQVMEALYGQIKLTMGDIHCNPTEGRWQAGAHGERQFVPGNDNDDPAVLDLAGFDWTRSDSCKTDLVDLARPQGFDNFCLRGGVNTRWGNEWLRKLRDTDRARYLQEAAEQSVAVLVRWREQYGVVPRWHQPFNEPTSGNKEVYGADAAEIVELVKAIGARLRKEGFAEVKLVVPSEETEEKSLRTAVAILADPEALQYVGAVSYHPYPYGSVYSQISNVLRTSGAGNPDPGRIEVRGKLRDLAKQHDLQLWMTEVSHGGAGTWETLLGRAVHIHDELVYADASSFWCMMNLGTTWGAHYTNKDHPLPLSDTAAEDNAVFLDKASQQFRITGMGYAIGHYARRLKRGSVRVEAGSDDPLVLVSAFRESAKGGPILVLINNADAERKVTVELRGLGDAGKFTFHGEQSTAHAFWKAVPGFPSSSPTGFSIMLPAKSVTTVSTDERT